MTGHPGSPRSASPSEGQSFTLKFEPHSDSEDSNLQNINYYDVQQMRTTSFQTLQLTCNSILPENQSLPNKFEPTSESSVHTLQNTNGSGHQSHLLQHLQRVSSMGLLEAEYSLPVPLPPTATPVAHVKHEPRSPEPDQRPPSVKIENLDTSDQGTTLDMDRHMTAHGRSVNTGSSCIARDFMPLLPVKDEPLSEGEQHQLSGDDTNDSSAGHTADSSSASKPMGQHNPSPKTWTQQDMENALEALRSHNMSLTKASATYGIPSTTLWQRAHRLGIDTPKKEGSSKSWSEADLHNALHALRTGTISANKASKAYGIPSSTLYKIARREGIRLAAPFNAAPTAWRPSDLERALHSIRSGHNSVQRASTEFGIPTGTLYGRCKREGIELSRSNPTPWSEDAMGEALEAVRVGQMSINQAAIHYNLPYSSLYGRFKRCKYEEPQQMALQHPVQHVQNHQSMSQHPGQIADMELEAQEMYHYQHPHPQAHHVPVHHHPMHDIHPQHQVLPPPTHNMHQHHQLLNEMPQYHMAVHNAHQTVVQHTHETVSHNGIATS